MENKTIQQVIEEKITTLGSGLSVMIADKLADVEISKRIETIIKAIQKQDSLEKDLKKINRNDVFTYVNGEKTEAMSKAAFDNIEKIKEKIMKVAKAIEVALAENTGAAYDRVEEVLKKIGSNADSNKGDSAE